MSNIHWIASYPKSGNTWVRAFLWAYLTGQPMNLNALGWYQPGDDNPMDYQEVSCKPLPELELGDQFMLRTAVLLRKVQRWKKTSLFMKTHHKRMLVNDIPLIPPALTAKAIYVVRDPRDVAVSFAHHYQCSVDEAVERMAKADGMITSEHKHGLHHIVGDWSSHVRSWIEHDRFPTLCLRYEDLLAKPRETFGYMVEWLGPVDKGFFEHALESTTFAGLQAEEQARPFSENPYPEDQPFFRKGQSGEWRDVLTPEQAASIETTHGEMMEYLSYGREYVTEPVERAEDAAPGVPDGAPRNRRERRAAAAAGRKGDG